LGYTSCRLAVSKGWRSTYIISCINLYYFLLYSFFS
jgi:hypothetical protein